MTRTSYAVDNSAILYLALMRRSHTNSYRFTVTMDEDVDPHALQQAMERVYRRFPTIIAGFRRDLLRYRVIPADSAPTVLPDPGLLIPMSRREIKHCAYRIFYSGRDISLEAFQSGLSWATILRKRPAFRAAFCDFDPEQVTGFGEGRVEKLLDDPTIIRNERKIRATISNARATLRLRDKGGLVDFVWGFQPAETPRPRTMEEVPTQSAESRALATALKREGFTFVGPTTMFALMEAIGMVDTHLLSSHRRGSSGVWPG